MALQIRNNQLMVFGIEREEAIGASVPVELGIGAEQTRHAALHIAGDELITAEFHELCVEVHVVMPVLHGVHIVPLAVAVQLL